MTKKKKIKSNVKKRILKFEEIIEFKDEYFVK